MAERELKRMDKALNRAESLIRKYILHNIKRVIRKAKSVTRNVVYSSYELFIKGKIKNVYRQWSAERLASQDKWELAKRQWEKILSSYKNWSPLEIMHLHKERSSIALLGLLADQDKYKRSIRAHAKALEKARASGAPKIAVYTCITGGYDQVKLPTYIDDRFEYFLFTDGHIDDLGLYQIKPITYIDEDKTRSARYIKTHAHTLFPGYDYAIWVDANIIINGDVSPILDQFIETKKAVGAIPHPLRNSTQEEGKACIALNKDEDKLIAEQLRHYRKIGFNKKGLIESNFMIFDLKDKRITNFFDTWWREINQYSRRDQLSLMFALDNAGIDWHKLMQKTINTRNHPLFVLIPHGTNEALQEKVVRTLSKGKSDPYDVDKRSSLKGGALDVDIVVCVHNAYEEVKGCLGSIARHRKNNHRLIIVDDGSEELTRDYLVSFAKGKSWVKLHRNSEAGGYTKAANKGMSLSSGDLVIMLNSDTVATKGWVDKLSRALKSVPRGGIVGPMSSAASHQSIPEHISSKSQTAVNGLPDGVSVEDMNSHCEEWSSGLITPIVPLVHGFCFGVTREVIETIGYLDEKSFPRGYGEETDYCFRATDAGFNLVIAPDTYIFHHKSKSYDDKKRVELMRQGSETLKKLYGPDRIRRAIITMQKNPILVKMREEARKLY